MGKKLETRLNSKIKETVRQAGVGEDIVETEDLAEFFNQLPRLEQDVETECKKCGKGISKKITGIQGFF